MSVVICSIFRDSESYLDRYCGQVASLVGWLAGGRVSTHLIWVEGDSSDNTYGILQQRGGFLSGIAGMYNTRCDLTLLKHDHGGPKFGSVEDDIRWRNISAVCNTGLAAVREQDTSVIYVESDLIWSRETMLELLDDLNTVEAVAPMCFHQPTGLFYDTWGHRKDGVRFSQHPPYHPGIQNLGLTRINSAGSCIAMQGDVARKCRFNPPELGIVGLGMDMLRAGKQLWLDPRQSVYHP